ncbi:hypothetical protein OOK41_11180 [Micromonospora sp. NBC_01655]|uniref:NACHT domain-containing protein n=1 Tax=Micromonospora sp. NBC_01655 TaxID=2975983 RepID=UPI002250A9B2|nr:hypothetical protein [Micromonospora sp. NBC_01655]MCX4470862.1 hypothetical protein [Micromonospora sp. NBC_01655]
MPDVLSYADAVRLLGGEKSRLVDWFDRLTGGVLLAASVSTPALLGIFDAKAEFVRLGHDLVRSVVEQRSGLSRYGRTRRLEAAHAVIAVTAFFEALQECDLPLSLAELGVSKAEQLTLAGSGATLPETVVRDMFALPTPVPRAELPYQRLRHELADYYLGLAARLEAFLEGLTRWLEVPAHRRAAFSAAMRELPALAADRHRDLLTALAADFPEVAFWAGIHEHQATRGEVAALAVGLGELRRELRDLAVGRAPDARREALARACAAQLDRPVIESGDVPDGLRVPTLGAAYVPPLCRVAALDADARPSDESWWEQQPVRADLPAFLTGHLTSPGAPHAPLLVLGQPGSGKSVLTRVLAAQLPATDFLAVRVVLREVRAEADVQDQIEQAVRAATGERLDWPALARSAGDALPVVVLDGFDELLQATGVTQTDYLFRVAAFQRREAEQGRPLAVLVTSRTSVADRAKPPPGTVALRLEPFDESRIWHWVRIWNETNAGSWRAAGKRPLDPSVALAHRELAEQPLLLLMLALYDADGNDLRAAGGLRQGELYERLLTRFARREVAKHRRGLPDRELDRAVDDELGRLAAVAFAMFNRGTQWVTEDELEADLAALPFLAAPLPEALGPAGFRAPLRPAETVFGRFFFVHRSQALRADDRVATYEFLHATFGEYLVARTTVAVLTELAAREAATSLLRTNQLDDDPLHALLSFATLTGRVPIVGFLSDALRALAPERRAAVADVLVRLFRAAHEARPPRRFEAYRPRPLPVPARHAAYSANLLVLGLCAADALRGRDLYPGHPDVRSAWRGQALLWRSQLDETQYRGLVEAVTLQRLGTGVYPDVRLRLADPRSVPEPVDLSWTYPDPEPEDRNRVRFVPQLEQSAAEQANFECVPRADANRHALESFVAAFPDAFRMVVVTGSGHRSAARAMIDLLLLPVSDVAPAVRAGIYRTVRVLLRATHSVSQSNRLSVLLFDGLAVDPHVPPALVAELADPGAVPRWSYPARAAQVRCCLAFLGRDATADRLLGARVVYGLTELLGSADPEHARLVAEAVRRLDERNLLDGHRIPPEVADLRHPTRVNRRGAAEPPAP